MRVATRIVSFVALALLAGPAFADGKRDLDDGIAFYENLDTERALERLKQASEAKDLPAKERAKAFLYLGMVHFENGERPAAIDAWKKSFQLDRAVAVPAGTSPKTIEAIEAARSAESAPKPKDGGGEEPGGVKKSDPLGGAPVISKSDGTAPAGGAVTTEPAPVDTNALPPPPKDNGEENAALTAKTTPPPEEDDDSLTTWLIIGGIAAALAGAAVVTVLVVSGSGDCKEGGGCLTVTFE